MRHSYTKRLKRCTCPVPGHGIGCEVGQEMVRDLCIYDRFTVSEDALREIRTGIDEYDSEDLSWES